MTYSYFDWHWWVQFFLKSALVFLWELYVSGLILKKLYMRIIFIWRLYDISFWTGSFRLPTASSSKKDIYHVSYFKERYKTEGLVYDARDIRTELLYTEISAMVRCKRWPKLMYPLQGYDNKISKSKAISTENNKNGEGKGQCAAVWRNKAKGPKINAPCDTFLPCNQLCFGLSLPRVVEQGWRQGGSGRHIVAKGAFYFYWGHRVERVWIWLSSTLSDSPASLSNTLLLVSLAVYIRFCGLALHWLCTDFKTCFSLWFLLTVR